jgi:hypothetical protein
MEHHSHLDRLTRKRQMLALGKRPNVARCSQMVLELRGRGERDTKETRKGGVGFLLSAFDNIRRNGPSRSQFPQCCVVPTGEPDVFMRLVVGVNARKSQTRNARSDLVFASFPRYADGEFDASASASKKKRWTT